MVGTALAPLLLPPILLFLTVDYDRGSTAERGKVVAAPHDGYDEFSGTIAKGIASRLSWGHVEATGFRSYPLRHWFDVNRPTERPWRNGGFLDARVTSDGERVHGEYLRKLRLAARVSSTAKIPFLVEIHGHDRHVSTSHGSQVQIDAIELATRGFTLTELRRLKRRYETLVQDVPSRYRVTLAVDRLDRTYVLENWRVPFYFYANGAKRTGSLQDDHVDHALHFELPASVRENYTARTYYTRLLAKLVDEVSGY